jgi:hypothetical protein
MEFQITFPEGFSYTPTKLPTQETIDARLGIYSVESVADYEFLYCELQEILIAKLVAATNRRTDNKRVIPHILAKLIRLSTLNHEMIHLNDIIRLTMAYSKKSAAETIRRHRAMQDTIDKLERIYGL